MFVFLWSATAAASVSISSVQHHGQPAVIDKMMSSMIFLQGYWQKKVRRAWLFCCQCMLMAADVCWLM
jgi:thiosulfate reductase cytochrome b subunit